MMEGMMAPRRPAPLTPQQCLALADALEDTPETVISAFHLRKGLARAYAVGNLANFQVAVVEAQGAPGEPVAFGSNVTLLARLLTAIPGWFYVNVSPDIAPALGPLLAGQMERAIRYYGDLYHTLEKPAPDIADDSVRLLTIDDLSLLEAAPPEIRGPDPRRLLVEMAAAGAVLDSQIVAIAILYARSAGYADIGVHTLPEWRGRGLATAAAALIARHVQAGGRIPVWSCGEDNYASLRVAQKLGFREVSRRIYLILNDETT